MFREGQRLVVEKSGRKWGCISHACTHLSSFLFLIGRAVKLSIVWLEQNSYGSAASVPTVCGLKTSQTFARNAEGL